MKTALAIRHIDFEDLGFFYAPLRRAGYEIRYIDAGRDSLDGADEADFLVVLGGPMGVYEADRYPFLTDEVARIARRIAADKPTLGICLGAQLIAASLGARVYPGGTKEIGFAPVALTDAGRSSPLAAITDGQAVLHWHGDTFDLPTGADLLASTDACAHQAFAFGNHVLALQFHLEAGDRIERWLTGHSEEIRGAGIDPEELRSGAARHSGALAPIADAVLTDWLARFG